jgi:hypothetical protein
MSFCPRCVQPVVSDAVRCPHCEYDIPPVIAPTTHPSYAEQPLAVLEPPRVAEPPVTSDPGLAADPWERTTVIPTVSPVRSVSKRKPTPRLRMPGLRMPRLGASRPVMLAAVVTTMVVLLGTALILARHSDSPPRQAVVAAAASSSTPPKSNSPASDRAQAAAIAAYLSQSAQARQGIVSAITAIAGCHATSSAVTTLQNAATARAQIVQGLRSAQVSALPNGAALVADLGQAMSASADADQHYAAWGRAVAGCTTQAPHNADFAMAQQSDAAADTAKVRFVSEWNQLASAFGLASQSASAI